MYDKESEQILGAEYPKYCSNCNEKYGVEIQMYYDSEDETWQCPECGYKTITPEDEQ